MTDIPKGVKQEEVTNRQREEFQALQDMQNKQLRILTNRQTRERTRIGRLQFMSKRRKKSEPVIFMIETEMHSGQAPKCFSAFQITDNADRCALTSGKKLMRLRLVLLSHLGVIHMTIVNIHEAKTNLSKLISEGKEVIIARYGVPVARLIPIQPHTEPRKAGSAFGTFQVPSEFFDPFPDEFLKCFEK